MIGSFLSERAGTKGISEKIIASLASSDITFICASDKKEQVFRMMEIIYKCLFVKFDLIHIDTFSGRAFRIAEVASAITHMRRKKTVLTLHGGKLPVYYEEFPMRVRKVLNRAEHVQTPSLYMKEFFSKQGIKMHYIPNSINLQQFPYGRNNMKSHSLLWVRAFDKIYNPDLAVKALSEVKKTIHDATLTMVGPDKGLLGQTKALVAKLDLNSSVRFTGPIQNTELYSYYQTHEVFLNTTSYESFGVAVLEAAACGIPVVSTAVGEIPYLWKNEENMLIVDTMKPEDFSVAIIRLFKSQELSEKISIKAREKAEDFDWEKIRHNWIILFSDLGKSLSYQRIPFRGQNF